MINLQERMAMVLAKLPPQERGFQADLARACGVKKPSVNGWLNGPTNAIDLKNAITAVSFFKSLGLPGINPMWLSSGDGSMFLQSNDFASTASSSLAVIAPPTLRQTLERLAYFIGECPPDKREIVGDLLGMVAKYPHDTSTLDALLPLMSSQAPD